MKLLTASALIAAIGVLVACGGYALSVAAPWVSEESCIISVATSSATAPAAGAQACRDRFSGVPAFISFSQENIEAIDGRAGFVNGRFVAQIYNGSYLNINRLRIAVIDPDTAESDEPFVRNYEVSAQISSLSSGEISFSTFEEYDQVRWYIVNAWGSIGD